MKREELQAIRERVNNATPGPWVAESDDIAAYVFCPVPGHYGSVALETSLEDAEFIAWCREGVPKLLNEIELLRNVLKSVQEVMNESVGVVGWHLNGEVATWSELGLDDEVAGALEGDK